MNKFGIFYPLLTGTDNPILRKKSAPILHFDQEVKDFAKVLLTLMYEYDGVGLAASQLGENIRMVALTQRKEQKAPKGKTPNRKLIGEYIMINPEILEHSSATQITEEACLSVPNTYGEVKRYQRIKVKYYDPTGKVHTKKLQGFNAVITQHEIDHLNGILFIDKMIRDTSEL